MRAKHISSDEQFKLILECRQRSLADYQWRQTNDIMIINPGTFYNWTSRLRKRGMVIPCSAATMEPAAAELQAAKSSSRNHETAYRFILIVPGASPVSFPQSQYLLTTVLYSSERKNFSLYLNAHLSKYPQ